MDELYQQIIDTYNETNSVKKNSGSTWNISNQGAARVDYGRIVAQQDQRSDCRAVGAGA